MFNIARRSKQNGVATLVVCLSILFMISIATFSFNRQASVEVQIAAEQYKHTQAVEAAQAGINEAVVMINDTVTTGAFCSSALKTYADSCMVKNSGGTFYIENSMQGKLTTQTKSTGVGDSTFALSISNPISGNFSYIRATSIGCTDGCSPCSSSCLIKSKISQDFGTTTPIYGAINATGNIEANSNTVITGNLISNQKVSMASGAQLTGSISTNSTLFNSGTLYTSIFNSNLLKAERIAAYNGNMITNWSGIPDLQTQINAITKNNTVITTVFINGGGSYTKTDPQGNTILNSDGTIGTLTLGTKGLVTTGNDTLTVGSMAAPVVMIVNGVIHFGGNSTFNLYGALYSSGEFHTEDGGTFNLFGLMSSIGDTHFEASSIAKINFSVGVLKALSDKNLLVAPSGALVRVLGSWRDF